VLEQKIEIEMLQKRDAERQKSIAILETRLKNYEGNDSDLAPRFFNATIFFELTVFFYFRLSEQLAKRPSVDELSAELEVLKDGHDSLQEFLKEYSEKETDKKNEVEEKHAQAIADLTDKLKKSNAWIKTLVSKAKAYNMEAEDIGKLIFCKDFLLYFGFFILILPLSQRVLIALFHSVPWI
jgi:ElaB/YqjD/DUF883 family membrane-anchored ribosome-binding protein